jgi:hypothetical protein
VATGGIVEVDTTSSLYRLPAEHSAVLGRAAGIDNMATMMQYVGILGGVEDEIVECFRSGGGVSYDRYGRFHSVMAEDSEQSVASCLQTHVLPLVPGLDESLSRGIRVLDLGCGSGRIVNRLAEAFPKSRFTGIDLSREAIEAGRRSSTRFRPCTA